MRKILAATLVAAMIFSTLFLECGTWSDKYIYLVYQGNTLQAEKITLSSTELRVYLGGMEKASFSPSRNFLAQIYNDESEKVTLTYPSGAKERVRGRGIKVVVDVRLGTFKVLLPDGFDHLAPAPPLFLSFRQ